MDNSKGGKETKYQVNKIFQDIYIVRLSMHCINIWKRRITRQLKSGNLRFLLRKLVGYFFIRDLLGEFSVSSSHSQSGSKICALLIPDVTCGKKKRMLFSFVTRNSTREI